MSHFFARGLAIVLEIGGKSRQALTRFERTLQARRARCRRKNQHVEIAAIDHDPVKTDPSAPE